MEIDEDRRVGETVERPVDGRVGRVVADEIDARRVHAVVRLAEERESGRVVGRRTVEPQVDADAAVQEDVVALDVGPVLVAEAHHDAGARIARDEVARPEARLPDEVVADFEARFQEDAGPVRQGGVRRARADEVAENAAGRGEDVDAGVRVAAEDVAVGRVEAAHLVVGRARRQLEAHAVAGPGTGRGRGIGAEMVAQDGDVGGLHLHGRRAVVLEDQTLQRRIGRARPEDQQRTGHRRTVEDHPRVRVGAAADVRERVGRGAVRGNGLGIAVDECLARDHGQLRAQREGRETRERELHGIRARTEAGELDFLERPAERAEGRRVRRARDRAKSRRIAGLRGRVARERQREGGGDCRQVGFVRGAHLVISHAGNAINDCGFPGSNPL
ncbi:MAG: hypothetical protein IPJ28_18725 [Betaproteobacteria bacterium]|nr:hypothetical protein [Betaproteobacteria bacterium]